MDKLKTAVAAWLCGDATAYIRTALRYAGEARAGAELLGSRFAGIEDETFQASVKLARNELRFLEDYLDKLLREARRQGSGG